MKNRDSTGLTPDRTSKIDSILDQLCTTDPLSTDELVKRVAEMRGRPIHMESVPGITSEMPCGFWIALDDMDVIAVEDATSPMHRDHIVLHEISHMLLGHEAGDDLHARLPLRVAPDLVSRMLGRTSYDTTIEREAETLAGLIASRAAQRTAAERSAPPALRRMNTVLSCY
ncbi:hypothetical protein [Streptomyces albidoflavus]|uniref:hypothetical protein n=1 Tax=Streptomyces albidoflavus TaxID=1886 RepID=UPI001F0C41C0|nr:hypothetical protein [Streptomyces albidoflavus]